MKKNGKRLRLTIDEENLIYKHRANSIENFNDNTALDMHLAERGINKKDVVSVKHWQSASGDLRFSIVTKEDCGLDEGKIFNSLNKFIESYSPDYEKIKRKKGTHLLVINPADIHIGKYANELETGEHYDCETAVMRVLEGVQGLIDKSKGFDVDRVLFCIGNDVLHIDNVYNTTTKGTHQDTDGKWWEHYEIALMLYVRVIEMLREIAPVDVLHSMSNHDYQSGFHLAHTLKSWFRKADDVQFDISVSHRKYYQYGANLIGLEHGDGAKMDKLPLLMAQERPKMWSETKFRYWYLHHIHHKVKHKWRDAKDFIGVTVEYMRSPSSSDSWHSRKGFTGASKACEAFLHDKKSGQVARLTHYF
ncbi:MAG: hypothetical protein Unbinned8210contig1002_25 [Prokaryotic dsDNA virus sp.]|nr:MAG: hypothetical protein Unbinned8210contig1002_25 [Prokaryotic dsDNA virus sp.]|tara:strand:+ start:22714 stop:23799 length:1086 start_codon:yes stop_codon:yes gene_type:complete